MAEEILELDDRFWSKVCILNDPHGCWVWVRGTSGHGYGSFKYQGKVYRSYQLSYMMLVGPVPLGYELHHTCNNKLCVNPAHLEPVRHVLHPGLGEALSSYQRNKIHCPHGHPYDSANTYHYLKDGKYPARQCLTCQKERNREVQRARRRRNRDDSGA